MVISLDLCNYCLVTPCLYLSEQTSWERLCSNEKSILIAMCLFRLLNFCVVQTYYVADEYWQSLEVAHRQVFGYPFRIIPSQMWPAYVLQYV